MKKLIFTFALTLALTAGIASPISAAAQTKTVNPVVRTNQDGGSTPCPLDMCAMPTETAKTNPVVRTNQDGGSTPCPLDMCAI